MCMMVADDWSSFEGHKFVLDVSCNAVAAAWVMQQQTAIVLIVVKLAVQSVRSHVGQMWPTLAAS